MADGAGFGGITPPTTGSPTSATAAAVVEQLRQQNVQMGTKGRMLEEMRLRVEAGDTDRARLHTQALQAEAVRLRDLGCFRELQEQAGRQRWPQPKQRRLDGREIPSYGPLSSATTSRA